MIAARASVRIGQPLRRRTAERGQPVLAAEPQHLVDRPVERVEQPQPQQAVGDLRHRGRQHHRPLVRCRPRGAPVQQQREPERDEEPQRDGDQREDQRVRRARVRKMASCDELDEVVRARPRSRGSDQVVLGERQRRASPRRMRAPAPARPTRDVRRQHQRRVSQRSRRPGSVVNAATRAPGVRRRRRGRHPARRPRSRSRRRSGRRASGTRADHARRRPPRTYDVGVLADDVDPLARPAGAVWLAGVAEPHRLGPEADQSGRRRQPRRHAAGPSAGSRFIAGEPTNRADERGRRLRARSPPGCRPARSARRAAPRSGRPSAERLGLVVGDVDASCAPTRRAAP